MPALKTGLVRKHRIYFKEHSMPVKPMRAEHATDEQIEVLLKKFGYMLATPKLDGIRCSIQGAVALSKTLLPIPNPFIQKMIGQDRFNGYDGELIVGAPNNLDAYHNTYGPVMCGYGEPDFKLYIFDDCLVSAPYKDRYPIVAVDSPHIEVLAATMITNMDELAAYEKLTLDVGFEGVILRDPHAKYKQGKSTALQGGSIKVKRFTDGEAIIEEVLELEHNTNEKKVNKLGRSQRSTHKAGKVPAGKAGVLVCRDIITGKEVKVGVGKERDRKRYWEHRLTCPGEIIKYKSFLHGVKNKPRHGTFLGPRHPYDM